MPCSVCWLGHVQADVRALRLERRQVAQERKLDAVHSASLGRQLEQAAQDRAALQKEHGKVVTGMQEELTYYQHAKGAFQAQVGSSSTQGIFLWYTRGVQWSVFVLFLASLAPNIVVHMWCQRGPAMGYRRVEDLPLNCEGAQMCSIQLRDSEPGCTQVHQLERDVGNLKVDLAAKGQGDTRLLEERSELIDAKARLGRQAGELARRAQRAEADLAASRATAQALASNSAALEERLAEQACAHRSLQKRCAGVTAHDPPMDKS